MKEVKMSSVLINADSRRERGKIVFWERMIEGKI